MSPIVESSGIGGSQSLVKKKRGTVDLSTTLLMHFDGANNGTTFIDERGTSFLSSPTIVTSTSSPQFGSACLSNTSGYIYCSNSSSKFGFGTSDFTIDYWMNTNSATNPTLMGQYVDASNRWVVTYNTTNKTIQFKWLSGGTTLADYTSSAIYTNGAWTHIAIVRSGTSFYIFGGGTSSVLTETVAIGSNSLTNINADFQVGKVGAYATFAGSIDELRISNGTARWTSNFTPPTQAYN